MTSKEFFTTGDVSQLINISRATVSRKFDAGILLGKKNPITGERLISRESLLSFMRQYNLPVKGLDKTDQKHIILVSQDEKLRSLVNQTFSDNKRIKIDTIASGYDAIIMCSKSPTDLFIIDDELSDISCAKAVKALKRFDEKKKMKVLYCLKTYYPDKFKESGADDFLAKDTLERDELARKVALLLDITKETEPSGTKFNHNRLWPRISVNMPVDLEVYRVNASYNSEKGDARVENISLGGAYLSQIHLEKGNIPSDTFRLLLVIDQPPLNNWHSECKVARLKTNGALTAGVQFVNLSEQNKNKITSIIL